MTYLYLLVGLGLIVFGADRLVEGASSIARKAGISQFVIGLTIVGFGTSCPELVVSLTGAIQGNADIAVGNVVGSNIFNVFFILGLTALLRPVVMSDKNRKRDIPVTMGVTLLLVFCGIGGLISRFEAVLFLIIFAAYMYYCFKTDSDHVETETENKELNVFKSIVFVVLGLAALVFGGDLFVDAAGIIASRLGVSDKFIAVTVLAGGTSLPELATCIVAAVRGKDQLALGNVLGSNIFNILFILGCSAVVTPLSFTSMTLVDMAALVLSILLLLLWAYTGKKCRLDRWEAFLMLLCFAAYYIFLFNRL